MALVDTSIHLDLSLQKRSEKDKVDLMTLKEMRERLANRDAIREKQELEERAEAERELQQERAKRATEREQQQQQQQLAIGALATVNSASVLASSKSASTTTAAADTSSEVARKAKDKFKSAASKVIVKVLESYFKGKTSHGKIESSEDFKHLAKKVRIT